MTKHFSDSLGKQAVRTLWNTPLLRYLHETYGVRYRYMGLPGTDLIDINLWRDMIEEVIAFEVRARPRRGDPQGRRNIIEIRRKLRLLQIPTRAYFGPMEEVIVRRRDSDGEPYTQDKLITLYNLDFCDEVASPITSRDGERQVLRFDAIRHILMDQCKCYDATEQERLPFVVLLTFRNQMDANKLSTFLSAPLLDDTASYVNFCNDPQRVPLPNRGYVLGTHTWALKAFLFDTIRQYMVAPNISALFFPVVKYVGVPVTTENGSLPSYMFHWMIVCRFNDEQQARPEYFPSSYLTTISSISANDNQTLSWGPEPGEPTEAQTPPTPEQWFGLLAQQLLPDLRRP